MSSVCSHQRAAITSPTHSQSAFPRRALFWTHPPQPMLTATATAHSFRPLRMRAGAIRTIRQGPKQRGRKRSRGHGGGAAHRVEKEYPSKTILLFSRVTTVATRNRHHKRVRFSEGTCPILVFFTKLNFILGCRLRSTKKINLHTKHSDIPKTISTLPFTFGAKQETYICSIRYTGTF